MEAFAVACAAWGAPTKHSILLRLGDIHPRSLPPHKPLTTLILELLAFGSEGAFGAAKKKSLQISAGSL